MFSHFMLHFTDSETINIPARGVVIVVGPNNSGKSLFLREVERAAKEYPAPTDFKILEDYGVIWPDWSQVETLLEDFKNIVGSSNKEDQVKVGAILPNGTVDSNVIPLSGLKSYIKEKTNKQWVLSQLLKYKLVRMDGRSRFNLTKDVDAGDLIDYPKNIQSKLFQDDGIRGQLRDVIFDAFGQYLVIDPTLLGKLRFRVSATPPLKDEQSLNSVARTFHKSAVHIQEASDGVQAFTGIMSAVVAGEYEAILIDEPEAFLHPPLARKLGRHLARIASQKSGVLIAATHSPDFLMGCVQEAHEVTVVRLEYKNGKSRGKTIDPAKLSLILRSPLMRSVNVVSGLFYDGVIVTEGDNDRVFYGEIYNRLVRENPSLPSVFFLNAQNKQTMRDVVGPLREFGVPAAAIPDIDIVKDGGADWTQWLEAIGTPARFKNSLGSERATILDALNNTSRDMKRDGGLALLKGSDLQAANDFFDRLEKHGLFTVRVGELESWLPSLHVTGRKTKWVLNMLDRLGDDPKASGFVRPSNDDVWALIRKALDWIDDAGRRGMH